MFSVHTRPDGFEQANMTGQIGFVFEENSFSSPEAALLLVSTKNRDLWPGPTPEVGDSRTSRHSEHAQSQSDSTNLISSGLYLLCLQSHSIQNRNVVGPGQRSRFLVLTSGDDNKENSVKEVT